MKKRAGNEDRLDCVEMMHEGAALVRKEIEGMTLEEQLAYWRKGTEDLLRRQAQLRKKRSHALASSR
jgi:hypothetical protein